MESKYFVPFETAKLLKEKGYDTEISFYYITDGVLKSHAGFDREVWDGDPCLLDYSNSDLQKWYREENYIAAPTYHEVLDWLENKDIIIESTKRWVRGNYYSWFSDVHQYNGPIETFIDETREEAINQAIIYAIEIL